MELKVYRSDSATAALVVGHGAGAGQNSPFMVRTAEGLAARGIAAATFDFPYMTARRSVPDRPPVLEQAWRDAIAQARSDLSGLPLFIGGQPHGVLSVRFRGRHEFTADERSLLVDIATHVALAFRNAMQFGELERRADRLTARAFPARSTS